MMELTLGELVDRLAIVNCKIYHLSDQVDDPSLAAEQVAEAARKMQALNRQRSELKNAIDRWAGERHLEVKVLSPSEPALASPKYLTGPPVPEEK